MNQATIDRRAKAVYIVIHRQFTDQLQNQLTLNRVIGACPRYELISRQLFDQFFGQISYKLDNCFDNCFHDPAFHPMFHEPPELALEIGRKKFPS